MNRRGEIGETMTWIVATLVIIVILGISIFVVSLVKAERGFNFTLNRDSVAAKSLSAFMLTKDGEKIIFDEISDDEDLNDFNGKLSVKILKEIYSEHYSNVALKGSNNFVEIDFPNSVKNTYWESSSDCLGMQEKIFFPGNKHLRLCLK